MDKPMRKLLAVLLLLVAVPSFAGGGATMMMIGGGAAGAGGTALFSDDFETGDFSLWTSSVTDVGDLSIASDFPDTGTYAMKAVRDDETVIYANKTLSASPTEVWYRFRIRFNEVSSSNATSNGPFEVVTTLNAADSGCGSIRFVVNAATPKVIDRMRVSYKQPGGTYLSVSSASPSITPAINTYYTVKVHIKKSTTESSADGVIQVWFDDMGTPIIDESTLNFWTSWDANRVHLGIPDSTDLDVAGAWNTLIVWHDNFSVAETDIW
jgi:hypothetical protein